MGDAAELLKELPGYDPDVEKNRTQARQIMQKVGYGPGKPLAIKVSIRDLPPFRNTAVLLIDHLKQIYIDGQLEILDTSLYYPAILRKDFTVGVNFQGSGPDPTERSTCFTAAGRTSTGTAIAARRSTK